MKCSQITATAVVAAAVALFCQSSSFGQPKLVLPGGNQPGGGLPGGVGVQPIPGIGNLVKPIPQPPANPNHPPHPKKPTAGDIWGDHQFWRDLVGDTIRHGLHHRPHHGPPAGWTRPWPPHHARPVPPQHGWHPMPVDPDWHPDPDVHPDPDWHPDPDPHDPPHHPHHEPLELANHGPAPVSLWMNGRHEILPPGEVIHLPGGRRWQIKWELGPNRGTDVVSLAGGVFHFVATPHGWHLRPEH